MDFTDLIIGSRDYLKRFNYDFYQLNFEEFTNKCAHLFAALEDPEAKAAECLEQMKAYYSGLSKKEFKEFTFQDKQILALFLSPAAEKAGEQAKQFAEALRMLWGKEYPGNKYLAGNYEEILDGFDANLLGIPLRKRSKR